MNKSIRAFTIIFLGLAILACKEELVGKPERLLSKEQMGEIYYDLALLNAVKTTNQPLFKDYNVEIMPLIFKKHGIDSIQFVESDRYYASQPSVYEEMYKGIEKRFAEKVEELEEKRDQKREDQADNAQKVRDSLKNSSPTKKVEPEK